MLFYDHLGGTTIAGSWNPLLVKEKTFRALLGYSTRPEGSSKVSLIDSRSRKKLNFPQKAQVTLNADSILTEIARMGQGLIKEVVKLTS